MSHLGFMIHAIQTRGTDAKRDNSLLEMEIDMNWCISIPNPIVSSRLMDTSVYTKVEQIPVKHRQRRQLFTLKSSEYKWATSG